jgi:hypothetical protein
MDWALASVVLVGGVALLWLRRLAPDEPAVAEAPRTLAQRSDMPDSDRKGTVGSGHGKPTFPFAAVSVKPGRESCAAARELISVRYLERAAPRLPLDSCDAARCDCTFNHHHDRRKPQENDRRAGITLKSELYGSSGEPERRTLRGRRITDHS